MNEKVPFSKIKPGGFFRMKGRKALYQRGKAYSVTDLGQIVAGPKIGTCLDSSGGLTRDTLVTPINARIVED